METVDYSKKNIKVEIEETFSEESSSTQNNTPKISQHVTNSSKEVSIGNFHILLNEKLGGGSFGEIFKGYNKKTLENVAIKVEHKNCSMPLLEYEYKVLKSLYSSDHSIVGLPSIHCFCQKGDYNFLIVEQLGYNLEQLLLLHKKNKNCDHFSLKTLMQIADQTLTRIEFLHSKRILHRDLKPENFLVGLGNKKKHTIYMIDFGLSKKYITKSGSHIEYLEGKQLLGTARYASVYTHLGIEQSRRDDLESLAYILIYLGTGTLKWLNIPAKTKRQKYTRIMEIKRETPLEELCAGLPGEFIDYLKYVRSLQFEDEPDYTLLRDLFKTIVKRENIKCDFVYDWDTVRTHDMIKMNTLSDSKKKPLEVEKLNLFGGNTLKEFKFNNIFSPHGKEEK